MELVKSTQTYQKLLGEHKITLDESAETIIPDKLPDAARIVDASAAAYVKEKDEQSGKDKVLLSGEAECSAIYAADDGELCNIKCAVPFNAQAPADKENMSAVSPSVVVKNVEARLINSRKLSFRVTLSLVVSVYTTVDLTISEDVVPEQTGQVETRKEDCMVCLPVVVKCRAFSLNDDLEVPSAKPAAAQICRQEVQLEATDQKVIANKIIVKGVASIKLVYLPVGGRCPCSATFELPFSQIFEAEGAEEGGECNVRFRTVSANFQPVSTGESEGRYINASISAEALIVCVKRMNLSYIADLYSTAYDTTVKNTRYTVTGDVTELTGEVQIKESVDTGMTVNEVVDMSVTLMPVNCYQGSGNGAASCDAVVRLLYLGSDEEVYGMTRRYPVEWSFDADPDAALRATASCVSPGAAVSLNGGIDIRFSVEFNVSLENATQIETVDEVVKGSDKKSDGETPAFILRYVKEGESYFDLGKKYNTVPSKICAVNKKEKNDFVTENGMLLIPVN